MANTVVLIPVYSEAPSLPQVVQAVKRFFSGPILIVDDGSTDSTPDILSQLPVKHVRHPENRGYGAALRTGLSWAMEHGFSWAITMDADGQHEPAYLPIFLERIREEVDIVSGSRYLRPDLAYGPVPEDRRWVNQIVTALLRGVTGYNITDAFCGFRALRLAPIPELELTQDGYGFPVEFWIKAAHKGLRVEEVAVPLIYHDFDKGVGRYPPRERLAHYLEVAAEALRWTSSS